MFQGLLLKSESVDLSWMSVTACSVTKSCPTLCNPVVATQDRVRGISQARIRECISTSSSRGSSQPRDRAMSPSLAGGLFTVEPAGKPLKGA